MSDNNQPERIAGKRRVHPGIIAAIVAIAVVLIVGALYAFSGAIGNPQTAGAGSCTIDENLRAKLDRAAQGEVAAFKPLDRPISMNGLAFKNENGADVTLAGWNGRTVLFNLWATWCVPCRVEMPALESLNRDLGGETFEVVPVSVDLGEPDKPRAFYKEIGLKDLGFFHDSELATLNVLKAEGLAFGLPATVLVGKDGCALGVLAGPAEWASEDAKRLVNAAL